jgi:transposase
VNGSPTEPSLALTKKQLEYAMAKRKKSTFERLHDGGLNRQQRKELERRFHAADPDLQVVHPHAAGIDIGNESHFVAVAPGRDARPVREFGSWTADLHQMAAWLKECAVTTVAIQSTGVYWIAVYEVLEKEGFDVYLVNARGTKNLPGRKSDVQESEWLRKLHTYGLLRKSYRPPEEIRAVRTLWRLRDRLVKEAGRAIQHIQKALTTMNVQLGNVISDLSGVTGMAIVRAIVAGQRDPKELAKLRDRRIRASEEEIAHSLAGNWQQDVLFELGQVMEAYDFHQKQMAACDVELQKRLSEIPDRRRADGAGEQVDLSAKQRKKRKATRKSNDNRPQFDLGAELERLMGVDLRIIDGLDVMTAQTIYSELGPHLSAFPTEKHFAAWLGLSPRREVSGGKVIRHEHGSVKNRVANALRNAAQTLSRSDSYLGARYRQLRGRLGGLKAVKAMARYLACLIYRLLTKGQAWVDRGAAHYEKQREERELLSLQRKASTKGLKLVPVD